MNQPAHLHEDHARDQAEQGEGGVAGGSGKIAERAAQAAPRVGRALDGDDLLAHQPADHSLAAAADREDVTFDFERFEGDVLLVEVV